MKKLFSLLLATAMILTMLTACGTAEKDPDTTPENSATANGAFL